MRNNVEEIPDEPDIELSPPLPKVRKSQKPTPAAAKDFSPVVIGALFFVALAVCMLSPINPLSNVAPGMDSSVFLTIAQGMHNGKIPYVDFFDHKGPLLYFINYVGLFLGGRTGVWFLELFSMSVAVVFAYKTALLFSDRYPALLGTACTFAAAITFFAQGNVPEEYAMPLIFLAFFIYSEHLLKNVPLTKLKTFITGACFGASLLLKPNLFTVWFVFSATIIVLSFLKKKYKELVFYVIFFFSGTLTVLAPFTLYLWSQGAFEAFIDQYIIFNRTYASDDVPYKTYLINAFATINKAYTWLVILAGLLWLAQKFKSKQRAFYVAYFLIVVIAVAFVSFSRFNFYQYSLVLIPLLAPAWSFFINAIFNGLGAPKSFVERYVIPLIAFVCVFNYQVSYCVSIAYLRVFPDGVSRNYAPMEDVERLSKVIRRHTTDKDKITVWGNACYVYYYSGRDSASKYIYQWPPANRSPKIAADYQKDILRRRPKLIIVPLAHTEAVLGFRPLFPEITPLIQKDYVGIYEQKGFVQVFERKN